VRASQVATVLLTLISAEITRHMDSIGGAWKILIVTGAGTGGVLLLRWYWWRINAWSEVAAMACAAVVSIALQVVFGYNTDEPKQFALVMITTVAITTVVWLAVTYLTKPEPNEKLVSFYRRTRPSRAGWAPVAALAPDVKASSGGLANLVDWIAGCALVYGALFGVGKLLLHDTMPGLILLAISAISGFVIYRDLSRRGWATVVE
jgi:Na+/proline symporter